MSTAHRHEVRVYYEDTDAGGIVYHAGYLRFAERARTEMLRAWGFDHRSLREEHGVLFAVRRCSVEFIAPARLDDVLVVETSVTRQSGVRLVLGQAIACEGRRIADLEVELVVLDEGLRPRRLPGAVAERLSTAAERERPRHQRGRPASS